MKTSIQTLADTEIGQVAAGASITPPTCPYPLPPTDPWGPWGPWGPPPQFPEPIYDLAQ